MSGSGEMAVRRVEKDVRSGDGEFDSGDRQGLASVLDRDSTVDNTCKIKSRVSPCDKITGSMSAWQYTNTA
jgi:hypothetical protein